MMLRRGIIYVSCLNKARVGFMDLNPGTSGYMSLQFLMLG